MKAISLFIILVTVSCSPSNKVEHDEDYVLIEFASKIEEDYHKIQSIPYEPDIHVEKTEHTLDEQLPYLQE